MKITVFSFSDAESLCECHSHKTGSTGGCLISDFVVCAHCVKGLIVSRQFFVHLVVHLTPLLLNLNAKLLWEICHP